MKNQGGNIAEKARLEKQQWEKKIEGENANRAEKPEGWEGRRVGEQIAEETGLEKGEKKQNNEVESAL